MRISLVSGVTTTYLAGQSGVPETTHSAAAGFTVTAARDTQTVKKTRAATAVHHDRLNLVTTITFTTTRTFASPQAAQLWALDHERTLPNTGTLVIDAGPPYGTDHTTKRHLNNAIVAPPARRCDGCSLTLSYTVTGADLIAAPA